MKISREVEKKLQLWKNLQQDPQPTTLKQACDYAATQAEKSFMPLLNHLQEKLLQEKAFNKELKASYELALAQLEATKQKNPALPHSFKRSPELQAKHNELKALQSVVQIQEREELDHFLTKKLTSVNSRLLKIQAEEAYKHALASDYSSAVRAINSKKEEVQKSGIYCSYGVSGHEFKGIYDPEQKRLFTFESIFSDEVSIAGKSYNIKRRNLSDIGAGNEYFLI